MDTSSPTPLSQIAGTSRQLFRRVLTIGGNRVELLLVELQEERERLLLAIILALGLATFGLLGLMVLTAVLVYALWDHSPLVTLVSLCLVYLAAALFFYLRLRRLMQDWQTLPATLDQLKKDRECLEQTLN